jgi:beta-mannan synthase
MVQGWIHSILYVLFENAMGVVKLWAVVAGVLFGYSEPVFRQ